VSTPSGRPELTGLALADPPALWESLGFAVGDRRVLLGGVCLELGHQGRGIVGWSLAEIDGLPAVAVPPPGPEAQLHPNGAIGLDHVVVATADFDRTAAALDAAGMPLRRVVQRPDGARMGFRRLGPVILELVESRDAAPGPARFWGLVVVVQDLDALAQRFGDHLGPIKPAVQPGRHIATLRDTAGLGEPVAFMDPPPPTP
jgi:hypothetical protein